MLMNDEWSSGWNCITRVDDVVLGLVNNGEQYN